MSRCLIPIAAIVTSKYLVQLAHNSSLSSNRGFFHQFSQHYHLTGQMAFRKFTMTNAGVMLVCRSAQSGRRLAQCSHIYLLQNVCVFGNTVAVVIKSFKAAQSLEVKTGDV